MRSSARGLRPFALLLTIPLVLLACGNDQEAPTTPTPATTSPPSQMEGQPAEAEAAAFAECMIEGGVGAEIEPETNIDGEVIWQRVTLEVPTVGGWSVDILPWEGDPAEEFSEEAAEAYSELELQSWAYGGEEGAQIIVQFAGFGHYGPEAEDAERVVYGCIVEGPR